MPCMGFIANFIRFPAVQKFWKSVKIWQSYRQSKGGNFFEAQCIFTSPQAKSRSKIGKNSAKSRKAGISGKELQYIITAKQVYQWFGTDYKSEDWTWTSLLRTPHTIYRACTMHMSSRVCFNNFIPLPEKSSDNRDTDQPDIQKWVMVQCWKLRLHTSISEASVCSVMS